MATRRDFLKKSGLVVGGLTFPKFLMSCVASETQSYRPGIQLYTIRDAMDKDPKKSLKKIANLGYQLVEHATYSGTQDFYGLSPSEFSSVLKDNDLKAMSGHYALGNSDMKGTIRNDWEKAVEDAKEVGLKYMVCPFLGEEDRKTIDDYKKRAEEFNKAGEVCKDHGIQFCYHNHAFEFEEIDGQLPYDTLLSETDEDLVKMELDIYWAVRSGQDPAAMFDENPGRYTLWHVKDIDEESGDFTEVGNGTIDWPSLFEKAKQSGMKEFFVEQDATPGDPFDSAEQSITYLNQKVLHA